MDSLYLAGPQAYLDILSEQDDAMSRLMVVGHNPGIEDLVEQLTGQPDAMPTAAIAQVEFAIDAWADLAIEPSGVLIDRWVPRDLPG